MKHAPLLLLAACASSHPAIEPDASGAGLADAAVDELVDTREPFEVWRHREPIYELYVRHFSASGDFAGVEARLDELKALGVGILWLLPVNEIGSIDHIDAPHGNPYAVKAYERLNPEYGTEEQFRSLIRAAHHRGMSVLVDWVPNHTAWDNHLITEHPEWYVHRDGAIASVGGDFEWIAQLDWSNADLRRYMTGVMTDWVREYDFDGFRIDFAHHMPIDYFEELRRELEKIKPVFLLAEAGDVARHPAFDMTYDWDVYPVLGDVAHGARQASAIDDELYFDQLLPYQDKPEALIMRMTYNHDDNGRFTLPERYRGGVKAAAVLACTLPGKPLVFEGQEVGDSKSLGHDPAIKTDWSDPDGFRPFYTKLLQLFRASSALHHPGMADFRKIDLVPGDYPYAFVRRDGANVVLVIVNLSPNEYPSVVIAPQPNAGAIDGTYTELFSGEVATLHAGQTIRLAPWEYRVYVQGSGV